MNRDYLILYRRHLESWVEIYEIQSKNFLLPIESRALTQGKCIAMKEAIIYLNLMSLREGE